MLRRGVASLAWLLALAPLPAAAVPVTQPIVGVVTLAQPGSPLGVGVGSLISGSAFYDDVSVNPVGLTTVLFNDHPSHLLSLTIGSRTFDVAENDASIGAPAFLRFMDGDLIDLNLIVVFEEESQQFLFSGDGDRVSVAPILLFDPNGEPLLGDEMRVEGTLDFSLPAIPEPPAAGLLAVALLGLGAAATLARYRDRS